MERIGLEPGTELGGYRILGPLGAGAMGAVHRAVDGGGSQVALKLLHPHVVADPDARERLRREAAALQRVRHPALAQVLDLEIDSAEAFLVTELIDGPDLERRVRERGPLDPERLTDVADQLLGALRAVHAAGVVHRDIKPANVLLTADGPVLIDFGIAFADDDARVTRTGFVVGTPAYLAPELLDGAAPSPTTDWWGWAATLVFAATGRAPFGDGPLEAVLGRVRSGEPDVAGLDPSLARVLSAALAVSPERRVTPDQVVDVLRGGELPPGLAAAPGVEGDLERTDVLPTTPPTDVLPATPPTDVLPATTPTDVFPADPPTDVFPPVPPAGVPPADVPPTVPGGPLTAPLPPVDGAPVPPPWHGPAPWPHPDQPWPPGAGGAPWPPGTEGAPWPPGADADLHRPVAPRRTGTLLALLTMITAAGAGRPLVVGVVVVAGLLLARVTGLAVDALHSRRQRRGLRASDPWRVAVLTPWYLLRAVVGVLPAVVVGVSVTVIIAGVLWWPFSSGLWTLPGAPELAPNVVAAAGLAAGVVTAWFAPLSGPTRTGARWVLRGITPPRTGMAAVLVALLLVAAALLATVGLTPGTVEWWPGRTAGLSEGFVPWS